MRRIAVWLVGVIGVGMLSGCALKPANRAGSATGVPAAAATQAQATAASGVQCHKERVTGSLISTKVCTLKEQRDQREQSAQDMRDFLNRQVIGACPGTPGCSN